MGLRPENGRVPLKSASKMGSLKKALLSRFLGKDVKGFPILCAIS